MYTAVAGVNAEFRFLHKHVTLRHLVCRNKPKLVYAVSMLPPQLTRLKAAVAYMLYDTHILWYFAITVQYMNNDTVQMCIVIVHNVLKMGLIHETCVRSHLIVNYMQECFHKHFGIHQFFHYLYLFMAVSLC